MAIMPELSIIGLIHEVKRDSLNKKLANARRFSPAKLDRDDLSTPNEIWEIHSKKDWKEVLENPGYHDYVIWTDGAIAVQKHQHVDLDPVYNHRNTGRDREAVGAGVILVGDDKKLHDLSDETGHYLIPDDSFWEITPLVFRFHGAPFSENMRYSDSFTWEPDWR